MDWKTRKRIAKAEFAQVEADAVSMNTLSGTTLGWYDALVTLEDGAEFRVQTESLNPTSDVFITPVDRETADKLLCE